MSFEPSQHVGETVTFRGTARDAMAGAIVQLADGTPVYVLGLSEWSDDDTGTEVEITGLLERRPSRRPQVNHGGEQYHGLGATYAVRDATWKRLP